MSTILAAPAPLRHHVLGRFSLAAAKGYRMRPLSIDLPRRRAFGDCDRRRRPPRPAAAISAPGCKASNRRRRRTASRSARSNPRSGGRHLRSDHHRPRPCPGRVPAELRAIFRPHGAAAAGARPTAACAIRRGIQPHRAAIRRARRRSSSPSGDWKPISAPTTAASPTIRALATLAYRLPPAGQIPRRTARRTADRRSRRHGAVAKCAAPGPARSARPSSCRRPI